MDESALNREAAFFFVRKSFFTLNEFLLIITILCVLSIILFPFLFRARSAMKTVQCAETLKRLTAANSAYNDEQKCFAPAAISENYRWFGQKENRGGEPDFDFSDSPLYKYLGEDKRIKTCPSLAKLLKKNMPVYEKGGFGYGYNENIGSQRYYSQYDFWEKQCQSSGVSKKKIKEPEKTVMFTDTATKIDASGNVYINGTFAEAGFCKSYFIFNKGTPEWGTPEPTIHFRHGGHANVSWVDGHVSREKMTFSKDDWGKSYIGFFGPKDNTLFDPE